MLKGIPSVISPDLMHVLMSMGHGDELVLADGNFPADSHAQRIIRADGWDVPTVLEAILKFFPIDTFADEVAHVMETARAQDAEPSIWKRYAEILAQAEGRKIPLTGLSRENFYLQARDAYAIVATSEQALYANLILKKGVVEPK
jgi:L-fucose mutarotase